jgi:hypothetical protein
MAVDVGSFQAAFPVFRDTDPEFIKAMLARAYRWVDPNVWGVLQDDGAWLLTAHWLTVDPFGTSTAAEPGEKTTKSVYGDQFEVMKRAVTRGKFGGVAGGRRGCH